MHKFFRCPTFCEAQKGSPTKNFGTVRQKNINRNLWNPLFVRKFFGQPFFSETNKGCLTKLFGTVRRRLWQKIVIHTPFSYPKKFSIPEVFWNTEGFPYDFFRYGETKQFLRKNLIGAPSFIPNIFRYQKFSKTQKSFSTCFSVVWDRKLLTEIVNVVPPPTYSKSFSILLLFWNTEGFPYDVFR